MKNDLDNVIDELNCGDAILIDVREVYEWNSGHINGAISIPLKKIEDSIIINKINKNQKIYTYCRSGNRSVVAEHLMRSNGFKNVIGLRQGYIELSKKNINITNHHR